MAKYSASILDLARRGALHRYEALVSEIDALVRQFPDLRGGAHEPIRRGSRGNGGDHRTSTTEAPQDVRRRSKGDRGRAKGSLGQAEGGGRRKCDSHSRQEEVDRAHPFGGTPVERARDPPMALLAR
jgi:hypothetical protein